MTASGQVWVTTELFCPLVHTGYAATQWDTSSLVLSCCTNGKTEHCVFIVEHCLSHIQQPCYIPRSLSSPVDFIFPSVARLHALIQRSW